MNRRPGAALVGAGVVAFVCWFGCTTDVVDLVQGPDGSLARDNCTIELEKEWYRKGTCMDPVKGDYSFEEKLGCSEALDGGTNCRSCWWGKRTEDPCETCWSANKALTSSECHQTLP
jgi:hypothetical protein